MSEGREWLRSVTREANMDRLGSTFLTAQQRKALHASVVLLIDDALESLRTDGNLEEIATYLPPRFNIGIPSWRNRALLVSVVEVGGQLARTDTPALRCLAQVLALHMIIEHADVWLDSQGELIPDWGPYQDVAFEDTDFELLYLPDWDGIEDPSSEVAKTHGMVCLHPDDWFKFWSDEPAHLPRGQQPVTATVRRRGLGPVTRGGPCRATRL